MKLCSACLLGINCNYLGSNNLEDAPKYLLEEYKRGNLIPVCPEQLGGLPTPRSGARITEGDGSGILRGENKILTDEGKVVTEQYLKGAYETLKIAKALGITEAVLKQGSPSCGCGCTQGGLDSRRSVEGNGVTTSLLIKHDIIVLTEEDFVTL